MFNWNLRKLSTSRFRVIQINHYSIPTCSVSGCLLIWLVLSGCGGSGGESEPPPPTPVTVSFATNVAEALIEEEAAPVSINVNLSAPVSRRVTAGYTLAGTAQQGLDYIVEPAAVVFSPNQQTATLQITPIDDWAEEDTETIQISLSSFSVAASAGQIASTSLQIEENEVEIQREGGADYFVYIDLNIYGSYINAITSVINLGNKVSGSAQLGIYVFNNENGFSGVQRSNPINTAEVPSMQPGHSIPFHTQILLRDLEPNQSYIVYAELTDIEGEVETRDLPNRAYSGFSLNSIRRVVVTCEPPSRAPDADNENPLFEHQWNLVNTGQTAFSENPGTAGEDMGMQQTISSGTYTGEGVRVAVVDTGLELCHPDLRNQVVPGESFNFVALPQTRQYWNGSEINDPFLPETTGDHGTSVAGVIAASLNNGLGLRGIAPRVQLVGYNYLSDQCCIEDALGGSDVSPNSSQVDVFNMSLGALPHQGRISDGSILEVGTSQLREGRGAIYAKSAGNAFNSPCLFKHPANDYLGCASAGDPLSNLPYPIVIGALAATGHRASYSTIGSNLWIAAPAGERGSSNPRTITTDQFGSRRGYGSFIRSGLNAGDEANINGDYTSIFNGTSSAAPHITGAVALMLEANPDLTWRDVKHILALSARKPTEAPNTEKRIGIGSTVVTIQQDWVTNAANYDFHNWFGFGVVDVDHALSMIESGYVADSLGEFANTGWIPFETGHTDIPDNEGAGITDNLSVDVGAAVDIEAVQIRISAEHPTPWDLGIELTSPSGTTSILSHVFNGSLSRANRLNWRLLSNAFYGEDPNGTWQLKVYDAMAGDVGYLESWEIRVFYGTH